MVSIGFCKPGLEVELKIGGVKFPSKHRENVDFFLVFFIMRVTLITIMYAVFEKMEAE